MVFPYFVLKKSVGGGVGWLGPGARRARVCSAPVRRVRPLSGRRVPSGDFPGIVLGSLRVCPLRGGFSVGGILPAPPQKKEMCVTRAELALAEAPVRSLEGVPATFAALVCAALSVFSWLGVLSVARGWEARGVVGVGCSRCPGLRPESRPISA